MAKLPGFPPGVVINRAGVIGVLKKVPQDLRDHPEYDGPKLIERSTGTRDQKQGMLQAMKMLVDLEAEWEETRRQIGIGKPERLSEMSDAEIEDFAETVDTLVMLETDPDPEAPPEGGERLPADPAALVEWAAAVVGFDLAPELLPNLRDAVASRLAQQPPANPHQAYAAKAVATLGYQPKKRRPRRTLNDLIKLFEDERLEGGESRLASNYTTVFDVLRSELGNAMLLDHIDRDSMRQVRDVILSRPLAPATQRKYCRGLGTLFAFAVHERWMDVNPALGLAPKPTQEEEEDRKRPFTQKELTALFPDGWALRSSVDWMLALGLFAGLRGEEAAQIEASDVEEIDGVWSLHIRPWTQTEDDGRDYSAGKRVKNRHSWRTVPIHPQICADLVTLAKARAQAGEKMLLEGVKKWGKEGYYGSIRKDVFARLEERGVKTKRTSHHSLRHNFRDALRKSKMIKDHQLALGGWSLGKGAEADYGEGFSPADLAPSLAMVTFPIGKKGEQDQTSP